MSENANQQQARTIETVDHGKLDLKALTLYAILLAAGFVLNLTVSKFFSGLTGGILSPEFIIAAFCLEILLIKPNVGQAAVIGLLAGVVIQITASVKGPDLIAEPVAAVVMALLVSTLGKTGAKAGLPLVGTFVVTFISGMIYAVIFACFVQRNPALIGVMAPVVAATGVCNGIIVAALYLPVRSALKLGE
ncbi:hypothetical protein [Paratractidigestivibacter sp.]|uniref:hypothetical protein n=1 Tax=Paratractidigestivibacter sp. TaxID=2847316 RepID=UPI002ABE6EF2|nr:hypothetical protein [Paratractidigestivibacter sp.]